MKLSALAVVFFYSEQYGVLKAVFELVDLTNY